MKESRSAQPLKLVYNDKAWYLSAFCLLRQDYRLFRVSRITDFMLTDTLFMPIADKHQLTYPKPWYIGPMIDIELVFPYVFWQQNNRYQPCIGKPKDNSKI